MLKSSDSPRVGIRDPSDVEGYGFVDAEMLDSADSGNPGCPTLGCWRRRWRLFHDLAGRRLPVGTPIVPAGSAAFRQRVGGCVVKASPQELMVAGGGGPCAVVANAVNDTPSADPEVDTPGLLLAVVVHAAKSRLVRCQVGSGQAAVPVPQTPVDLGRHRPRWPAGGVGLGHRGIGAAGCAAEPGQPPV